MCVTAFISSPIRAKLSAELSWFSVMTVYAKNSILHGSQISLKWNSSNQAFITIPSNSVTDAFQNPIVGRNI